MKRIEHKLYMVFLGILICISLTGCSAGEYVEEIDGGNSSNHTVNTENEESSENVENISEEAAVLQLKPCAAYQDILDNAYEVIITDNMTDIVSADELFSCVGIREAKIGRDTSEALACIGYTFYDVDGNGIEELIIADMSNDGGGRWDNRILLMYTLHDDKPVLLIDGWARNRYYLLNDGTIYHEGSGGAAYTAFATYRMAENGISLDVIDYYFSDYQDDSSKEYWLIEGNWGWFHNTTGEQKKDESEWTEFENEDVPWKMMEGYLVQVKELELTFFEKFKENQ